MSSFRVSYQVINDVLDLFNVSDADNIGKKLIRLNLLALKERYGDKIEELEDKEFINEFSSEVSHASTIQKLKSLSCLIYQCSEGKVVRKKLYKQLLELEKEVSFQIIRNLDEYDKADWGR